MITEQIDIDGLDVNDYVTWYIADEPTFQFIPAKKKLNWSSSALADGSALVGDEDHYDNAELIFAVGMYPQPDVDTALTTFDTLVNKLQEARRTPGGMPLTWTPAGSSSSLTFYILEAELDELLATRDKGWFDAAPSGVIHLYLRPFGYGQEQQAPLGYTDTFASDTFVGGTGTSGPWRFDAGSGTLAAGSGNIVSTTSSNKRLYLPFTTVDSLTVVRLATSSTMTSMEIGVMARRSSGTEYLRATLTPTQLKIGRGASDLATTNVTPTASTWYWLQVSATGNDIQADLYADGLSPLVGTNLTPLASVSYTLAGADATAVGLGVYGNPGLYLTPGSAGFIVCSEVLLRGMNDIQSSEPVLTFEIPDVKGHVPAQARQVVSEGAGQTRAHYEWGLECRDYNPDMAWRHLIDSQGLVTTGFTGTQFDGLLTYDPDAVGVDCIRAQHLTATTALTVCGTGPLPHVGSFKVRVRVAGDAGVRCRLAWRIGDGPLARNNYAANPVTSSTGGWYELDLGSVVIPRAAIGTQSWEGRIEAYSPDSADGVVYIDYIEIIPMEQYGIARAPIQPVIPTTFAALDEFETGSGNLTGRVATTGGTWTVMPSVNPENMDADDFTISGPFHGATRVAVSDPTLTRGRLVSVGDASVTYGAVVAQVNVWVATHELGSEADIARFGLFVRGLDINNWVGCFLKPKLLANGAYRKDTVGLAVYKRVAGAAPVKLGEVRLGQTGWDHTRTIQLAVDAAGVWAAYSWSAYTPQPGKPLLSGVDNQLIAPLTVGRVGIYDSYTDPTPAGLTRLYDNFQAFVAPQDAVIFANRQLEVRSDRTERAQASATAPIKWGKVPQYRGSRFFVPATGEGHISRMAVKARRTDVDGGTPDNAIADAMTVSISTTPRYLTPAGP